MPDSDPLNTELTIGQFATQTGLTAKALRLYGTLGIVEPARVDPVNGYRYYRASQVLPARMVGMLRGAQMSLDEIAALLSALAESPAHATQQLSNHLAQLEAEHAARRVLIQHIHSLLQNGDLPMFPVETKHIPAERVMSMQRRLLADQTDEFVAQAKAAFVALLDGRPATGPFTVIFHGIVDHENDGPIEAIMGCSNDVEATDLVSIRTEPAHDVAFTTITKEQWAFPAILAAYDAVACSEPATSRAGSPLACREIYLAEPNEIALHEPICDVAWPLS